MSRKTLLTSASVLLGAVIAAPNAALAQFGPPPGPPPLLAGPPPGLGAGGPPPGLGVGGAPLGGPSAGPVAGLPPRGARAHLRATSPVFRLVSMVLADCMVSSVAARPIFAASKVAPRATALTASLEMVTPAMAVATGTGLMPRPRLQLTPMADPMPPPTTAATPCPPTDDMAPEAFWSVVETD
jgi:hypothetical protein